MSDVLALIEENAESLSELDKIAYGAHLNWLSKAKYYQIAPPLEHDWTHWLVIAGRGAGKQLCVDTPIPTPSGWIKNGDLKAGDKIFDEQGNVCNVIEAHPIKIPKTAYRVKFSDGSYIDADGEHLWTTMTHRTRKQMTRHGIKRIPDNWASYRHPIIDSYHNVKGYIGAETLTTEQIKQTFTHGVRKDLNHCIPTTQPLNLPEVDLPIDPYLLGSWLGDGSSKEQVIWGHLDDIGLIESHAKSLGYETTRKHDKNNTWCVRIYGLSAQLRSLGVFGNKHVPNIYLRASVEQRLALLQGLMDTDGFQDSKTAEFCNTNLRIAEAVYELAVSLGEKPVMKESRAKIYGKDCGEKYRITWRWNRFNPLRMERKRGRLTAPNNQSFKHGHRMIVSIEPIDSKPMRCITVDSPSRLYLAGEAMIPTHNTRLAAETLWWWAWSNPKSRCLILAPTANDCRLTCLEGESGLLSVIPQALVEDYNKTDMTVFLKNGSQIRAISADTYERLRGPQFSYAWCDELAAFQYLEEAWDMMMFGLRLGKSPRVIVTTTPKPKDKLIELMDSEDSVVDTASTYENIDNLAPTFQKQILQYEGTRLGRQELHAELIDPEESGVVTRDMFRLWPNGKALPDFEYIIQSYDCGFKDKEYNDPTAATTWGCFKPLDGPMAVLLIDCWQEKLTFPDLKPKVIEEYQNSYGDGKKQKRPDLILVEDKAAGISLIQELQRAHLPVRGWNPGRADKMQRLQIAATVVAAGRVWLPESSVKSGYVRDWVEPMLSQLCSFPESNHDDFVDSTSMALRFLKDTGWLEINPPPREEDEWYADDAAPKRLNPYAV